MTLDDKYSALIALLKAQGSAAAAFSGGVDSSFLCYAAKQALGSGAIAVTVVSPMLPKSELDAAIETAALIGIKHILIREDDIDSAVAANPKDRCYHCKKIEFGRILEAARENGCAVTLDGTNLDDEGDYRPGLAALAELKILSPLRAAGLHKDEIRELSRRFHLPTWDKPAYACLASRIPYGQAIDSATLGMIEQAEDYLRSLGFRQFRVRAHGGSAAGSGGSSASARIARIEAAPNERRLFFNEERLDAISRRLKALGFLYVTLELEGYAMGSMNRALTQEAAPKVMPEAAPQAEALA
jgi:uncharacterized protein